MTRELLELPGVTAAAEQILGLLTASSWSRSTPDDADVIMAAARPISCVHGLAFAVAGYAIVDRILDDLDVLLSIDRDETMRRIGELIRTGDAPGGLLA